MGKIRQLREDQIVDGGSQEHIYPVTHAKAVYTKDNKPLQDVIGEVKKGDLLDDESIKTRHLADGSVTNSKLAENSVNTENILDNSVTTDKLVDSAVTTNKIEDYSVTHPKLANESVDTNNLIDESVTTDKLVNKSVTTDKIEDDAIITSKIKGGSITPEKLNQLLKDTIDAATGVPGGLVDTLQDITGGLAEIKDDLYPITPSINAVANGTYHTVDFSVKRKGSAFIGDYLLLTKTSRNGNVEVLSNISAANGTAQSTIVSNIETFKLEVGAEGLTTRSASIKQYICYIGASDGVIAGEWWKGLTQYSISNKEINLTIPVSKNDFIIFAIPSELSINQVTSQGIEVPLTSPGPITTTLGEFKLCKTVNMLTAQDIKLKILLNGI